MKVYPNPSSDGLFNVMIADLSGEFSLEVYSYSGKILSSQQIGLNKGSLYNSTFNFSQYAKGIYLIRLRGDNTTILKKLIISE
jgi:hypothetical protein